MNAMQKGSHDLNKSHTKKINKNIEREIAEKASSSKFNRKGTFSLKNMILVKFIVNFGFLNIFFSYFYSLSKFMFFSIQKNK